MCKGDSCVRRLLLTKCVVKPIGNHLGNTDILEILIGIRNSIVDRIVSDAQSKVEIEADVEDLGIDEAPRRKSKVVVDVDIPKVILVRAYIPNDWFGVLGVYRLL